MCENLIFFNVFGFFTFSATKLFHWMLLKYNFVTFKTNFPKLSTSFCTENFSAFFLEPRWFIKNNASLMHLHLFPYWKLIPPELEEINLWPKRSFRQMLTDMRWQICRLSRFFLKPWIKFLSAPLKWERYKKVFFFQDNKASLGIE